MRKYLFGILFLVLFSVCGNVRQADAYSVKVEKDSLYADVIPSNIMENVETLFRRQVKKVMKYYNKYKDADEYTYVTKIPGEYRDFIERVKDIQENDEIVIHYPFCLYDPCDGYWGEYECYFIAERNQERLCIFRIEVDEEGAVSFWFDKYDDMEKSTKKLDRNLLTEGLFYWNEQDIYAETPEQESLIYKNTDIPEGTISMIPGEGNSVAEPPDDGGFYQMSYEEKKEIVLKFLDDVKNGKAVKKSYETMEIELGDDYQQSDEAEETGNKGIKGIFGKGSHGGVPVSAALAIGIFCIVGAVIVGMVVTRQKRE